MPVVAWGIFVVANIVLGSWEFVNLCGSWKPLCRPVIVTGSNSKQALLLVLLFLGSLCFSVLGSIG